MVSLCIAGAVDHDPLIKVGSAGFLCCERSVFPFSSYRPGRCVLGCPALPTLLSGKACFRVVMSEHRMRQARLSPCPALESTLPRSPRACLRRMSFGNRDRVLGVLMAAAAGAFEWRLCLLPLTASSAPSTRPWGPQETRLSSTLIGLLAHSQLRGRWSQTADPHLCETGLPPESRAASGLSASAQNVPKALQVAPSLPAVPVRCRSVPWLLCHPVSLHPGGCSKCAFDIIHCLWCALLWSWTNVHRQSPPPQFESPPNIARPPLIITPPSLPLPLWPQWVGCCFRSHLFKSLGKGAIQQGAVGFCYQSASQLLL